MCIEHDRLSPTDRPVNRPGQYVGMKAGKRKDRRVCNDATAESQMLCHNAR